MTGRRGASESNGARGNGEGSPNIGEGQKGASPAAGDEEGATDTNLHREITRLSKLSIVGYEQDCKIAAEKLGIRAAILDKLVKDARPAETGQGRPLELPEPEPWASPVDAYLAASRLQQATQSPT